MFFWSAKAVLIVMTMQAQSVGFQEFSTMDACKAAKERIYDAMSQQNYEAGNQNKAQWAECVAK